MVLLLPWFSQLTSKSPMSKFCWHFLFVSVETGIISPRQIPSGPHGEWIRYEFCVCVLLFDLQFLKVLNLLWTFPKLADFLYKSSVPISLEKSERSGNAQSTFPCGWSWVVASFCRRSLCPVVCQCLHNHLSLVLVDFEYAWPKEWPGVCDTVQTHSMCVSRQRSLEQRICLWMWSKPWSWRKGPQA